MARYFNVHFHTNNNNNNDVTVADDHDDHDQMIKTTTIILKRSCLGRKEVWVLWWGELEGV